MGHSPKRILVPFVRTKGTPRRRAAQALHPAKSTRRRQATTNLAPAGQAYRPSPSGDSTPSPGAHYLGLKILLPTFLHRKASPRRRRPHISRKMHKFPICKNPPRARVRVYMGTRWARTCPRAGEKSHRTAEKSLPKNFCPNREQIFVSLLQSRQKSCTMESEYHHFGRKLHGHREKSKGNRPRPQR